MDFLVQTGNTPEINFYGWEVFQFLLRQLRGQMFSYPWQIRTAWMIVVVTMLVIIAIAIIFARQIRIKNKEKKLYDKCYERFYEPFSTILASTFHYSVMNVEALCSCDAEDMHMFSGDTYSRLLCHIRTEMKDSVSIPNMQLLCELTDVRGTLENNLTKGRNVLATLQIVASLPVRISEGRLATYINHHDDRTRHLARQVIGICTENDPFRYLVEDLNEYVAPYRFMSLHRLFGWLKANDRQMPDFITTAEQVSNDKSAAFMIEEVAHWGSDSEKNSISQFFSSPRSACKIAAIKVVAMLGDTSREEELIRIYPDQPVEVKAEILSAIAALNTGRQAPFFEKAYLTSPSKDLAEHALSCMYSYGEAGRKRFNNLRQMPMNARSKDLLDQIASMGDLEEMRKNFDENKNEAEA